MNRITSVWQVQYWSSCSHFNAKPSSRFFERVRAQLLYKKNLNTAKGQFIWIHKSFTTAILWSVETLFMVLQLMGYFTFYYHAFTTDHLKKNEHCTYPGTLQVGISDTWTIFAFGNAGGSSHLNSQFMNTGFSSR